MHHPELGFKLGSQGAAMILEVLICWDGFQHDPDGWIYKSHKELKQETGLSERQQKPAIKLLVDLGLVKKRVSGLPPTTGFLLQKVRIQEWWNSFTHTDILSESTNTKSEEQTIPNVEIPLYTSLLHDDTPQSTPAVVDSPVRKTEGFEYDGTFRMRKARDEYLAQSKTKAERATTETIREEDKFDPEVEQVIIEVQKHMKLPMLDRTLQQNRHMAKMALEKFGMEQIIAILTVAAEDEFWRSRVTSVSDVYFHGMKILSCKRFSKPKGSIIV